MLCLEVKLSGLSIGRFNFVPLQSSFGSFCILHNFLFSPLILGGGGGGGVQKGWNPGVKKAGILQSEMREERYFQ